MNTGSPYSAESHVTNHAAHRSDRRFLARLRVSSLEQLKRLRVVLVRENAPLWRQVAADRAVGRRGG